MTEQPVEHDVTFEMNTACPHVWKATCSCGWSTVNLKLVIVQHATAHANGGKEWIKADPMQYLQPEHV